MAAPTASTSRPNGMHANGSGSYAADASTPATTASPGPQHKPLDTEPQYAGVETLRDNHLVRARCRLTCTLP